MLIDLTSIGQQIKRSRLHTGLSQAELARLSDVSRATINGLENGTIKEIGVNRLNRIVKVAIAPSLTRSRKMMVSSRKSDSLGLSFPYDWSNPSMTDHVLIEKVVERGLFEDMVKIAARYGVKSLRQSVEAYTAQNHVAAPGLDRMLSNIEKAIASA